MSTDRAIHHDEGFGDALGRLGESAGEIPRPGGQGDSHPSGSSLGPTLPEVGSEAFQALNRRRVELIEKDIAGHLTGAERDELARLEEICGAALNRAFPLVPIDLDALIRLRDSLRAEKEGRGA
jgi:hypothetical protein